MYFKWQFQYYFCFLITLKYVDGILKKSIRTGSENFEKVYETLEDGSKIVTKTQGGNVIRTNITEIQNNVKKAQQELKELFDKKDELDLFEFKKQADAIVFKSKKQQDKINDVLTKKQKVLDEKKAQKPIREAVADTTKKAADGLDEVLPGKIVKKFPPEERKTILDWFCFEEGDTYTRESLEKLNDEQFEILEKVKKARSYEEKYHYPRRYYDSRIFSQLSSVKDSKELQRIGEIIEMDKGVNIEDIIKEYSKLSDKNFKRVKEMIKRGKTPSSYRLFFKNFNFYDLTDEEFQRYIDLKDLGYPGDFTIPRAITSGEKGFQRAKELWTKYYTEPSVKMLELSDADYQKLIERIKKGIPPYLAIDLSDIEAENFAMLVKAGCDSRFIDTEILNDKAVCLDFIKKFKNIGKNGFTAEQVKNDPKIRARIIKAINDDYGCEILGPDASFEDIAYRWKVKYVSGGYYPIAFSNDCEAAFLKQTLKRYETEGCEPLGRWMYRDDLYHYIETFPKEGETYIPGRVQSFAKTLRGAERIRGNNFSDTNLDKNIKFVVFPKEKVSKALDMGEGKYGMDEAIYAPDQEFEVLKKGFEMVTNPDGQTHRLYTIYMREK